MDARAEPVAEIEVGQVSLFILRMQFNQFCEDVKLLIYVEGAKKVLHCYSAVVVSI